MKVKIEVTKHDIVHGDMESTTDCVMARAIGRALPLAEIVDVGIWQYSLKHVLDGDSGPWEWPSFPLTGEITDFITKMFHTPKLFRWFKRPRSFMLEVSDRYMGVEPQKPHVMISESKDRVELIAAYSGDR